MITAMMLSHIVAAGGGTSGVEIIAWIGIPLFIFLCGVGVAVFRAIVKAAQWFTHQQEAADRTANSNEGIEKRLTEYINKSDARFGSLERDVAVLQSWRERGNRSTESGGWN